MENDIYVLRATYKGLFFGINWIEHREIRQGSEEGVKYQKLSAITNIKVFMHDIEDKRGGEV